MAPDGRVGTFAWTYDSTTATYLDIHRRISADGGLTWDIRLQGEGETVFLDFQ